jgi:hypothetical protein
MIRVLLRLNLTGIDRNVNPLQTMRIVAKVTRKLDRLSRLIYLTKFGPQKLMRIESENVNLTLMTPSLFRRKHTSIINSIFRAKWLWNFLFSVIKSTCLNAEQENSRIDIKNRSE